MPPSDLPDSALHRAIVEEAPEAIIFADREGMIRLWNRGAEELFGWSAGEALGKNLDLIIPERLRRAHWEGFDNAMRTGETKYGGRVLTTRSMHQDGGKLYVDLSFALVKNPSGAVAGAVAIGRDVTARHLADAELRSQVRTLEAQLAGAGGGCTPSASDAGSAPSASPDERRQS